MQATLLEPRAADSGKKKNSDFLDNNRNHDSLHEFKKKKKHKMWKQSSRTE